MIYKDNKSPTYSFWDYLGVFLIIISCGTGYFHVFKAGLTILSLFFGSVLIYYAKNGSIKINCFEIICFISMCLCILLYRIDIELLTEFLYLISTILILSSSQYKVFRKIFLNTILILVVLSLFFYILYFLGLIHGRIYTTSYNVNFEIYLFHVFHEARNGLPPRLSGIFWEPGIYQMLLNICLLLNTDLLNKSSRIRNRKLKLGLIVLAIILTFSTTGYIVLGTILIGLTINKAKNSFRFKILAIFVIFLFWIVITTSTVITSKFSMDNGSFMVRINDFDALLSIITENPILGSGINTEKYLRLANKYGLTPAQSAGILLRTAQLGIIWLVAFFYSLIKEKKKRRIALPSMFYILIFICLGIGEPLMYAPFMLINVLPFKSYN